MQTKTVTRTLLATGTAAALAAGAFAGSAQAICNGDAENPNCPPPDNTVHAVGRVDVAAGQTLGVRYVPVQKSKQYRQLPDGAKALITCQTTGSKVSGTFGTTKIWNHLQKGGFVSDAYVYTGHDGFVPGVPRCGA